MRKPYQLKFPTLTPVSGNDGVYVLKHDSEQRVPIGGTDWVDHVRYQDDSLKHTVESVVRTIDGVLDNDNNIHNPDVVELVNNVFRVLVSKAFGLDLVDQCMLLPTLLHRFWTQNTDYMLPTVFGRCGFEKLYDDHSVFPMDREDTERMGQWFQSVIRAYDEQQYETDLYLYTMGREPVTSSVYTPRPWENLQKKMGMTS